MPKHVLEMLDGLIENGSSQDTRVLAEGVKASLKILSEDVVPEIKACRDHVNDTEIHTPKGLLLRAKVVGWFIFAVVIISTIVAYLPEKIAMLSP